MSPEQVETDEFLYSPCLDLCIRWGRTRLLGRYPADLPLLDKEWDRLVAGDIDAARDLSDGFARFSQRVDQALALLASDATLNLDQDDAAFISAFEGWSSEDLEEGGRADVYRRLNSALLTLDSLAYLGAAGASFPKIADQKAFREKIQSLLDDVLTNRRPPTLRFIAVNSFRQERLRHIPEDEQYLFPWYEEWSHLPPEALDVVAETAAGWPKSAALSNGVAFVLEKELEDDPALLARIRAYAERMRLTFAALDEAHSLRSLFAADEVAAEFTMPTTVVKAGMVGAACRLAVEAIRSGSETAAWRFRAGLCGLGLSDEDRLALMKPVEDMIRDAKRTGKSLTGCASEIAAFPSEKEMARSYFTNWIHDIQTVAVAPQGFMPLSESCTEALYRKLLFDANPAPLAALFAGLDALYRRLSAQGVLATRLLERLRDLLESFAPRALALEGLSGERGPGDAERQRQPEPIQLDFLFLPLPELQERGGKRYRALLREPEAEIWRRELKSAGRFYWGGVGVTDSEEVRLAVKDASAPSSIRIDTTDYRLFLLGVSTDKEALQAAIEQPGTMVKVMTEGGTKSSGVAWVLYVRPEEESKPE
jgi:hypothetical protein